MKSKLGKSEKNSVPHSITAPRKSVAILSSPNPDLRTPYADKLLLERQKAVAKIKR